MDYEVTLDREDYLSCLSMAAFLIFWFYFRNFIRQRGQIEDYSSCLGLKTPYILKCEENEALVLLVEGAHETL